MSEEIVHIAGLDVRVGDQMRQRCAWCGAVIEDYDLTRIAVPEGQGPPAMWQVGALVAVQPGVQWVVEHVDDQPLPENCCAQLDHDVTGATGP